LRRATKALPDNATQSTLVINPGIAVSGWTSNHNETLVRDTD